MDRLFEFAANHLGLVALFLASVVGLIVVESRRAGVTVSNNQATQLINNQDAIVVDIRQLKEFSNGHITGAINMPYTTFKDRMSELSSYKNQPIILVCALGQHAGAVGKMLRGDGFQDIRRLQGGISGWQGENLPLVK